MDEMAGRPAEQETAGRLGSIGNLGKPLRLEKVGSMDGFLLDTAAPGAAVRISTFGALTSDVPLFRRFVGGLELVFRLNFYRKVGSSSRPT